MKKQLKWLITGILAFVFIGYFIYSSVKPLETEVLGVQTQTVAQTFKEEGIVKAAVERPVYSLINGTITRLLVEEGQKLKKGNLLVEVEAKDLEYQLEQLKAQKKSLLGQDAKNEQDLKQQLGQLQGQLESVKGQEIQANKSPYVAQLTQQQLVVEDIKRQLKVSKDDLDKIEILYESGAVSKQEFDQAKAKVAQLENQVMQQEQALQLIEEQAIPVAGTDQYFSGLKKALQTQIDVIQYELGHEEKGTTATKQYYEGMIEAVAAQIEHLDFLLKGRKVLSPINGVVRELPVREGEVITTLAPLLTIVSNDHFEVEVYLLTEDVISVEEGMKVELIQKRRDGDLSFGGRIKAIAPAAEEKVSALGLTQQKVKVTIIPDEQVPELRPGYALDVVFTTLEQQNKLAVPKTVLFPYEDGDGLWVVNNGKAVIRSVKTGLKTDELVVIEEGLEEGDQVIKNPQQEGLKEGKRVKE